MNIYSNIINRYFDYKARHGKLLVMYTGWEAILTTETGNAFVNVKISKQAKSSGLTTKSFGM